MTFLIGGTTGAMLAGTLISTAGGLGAAALSKGKGGIPPAVAQMPQDQKTAPTKPTAADFQTPPISPQQPAPQVPMPQSSQQPQLPPLQQAVLPGVPQDAQLGDFLKLLRRGEY